MADNTPEGAGDAPQFDDVPLDSILEEAVQASKDADPREEDELAWSELVETGVVGVRRESFLDRLNQRFWIDMGQWDVQLQLVQVEKLNEAPNDLGDGAPEARESFRVVFRGASARAALPEGIYRVQNDELGELELFLRPAWRPSTSEQPQDLPHLEALFS
ncbi:MAG: hypothetical protein AAGC60_06100 [Acidobacteriota bacterium]